MDDKHCTFSEMKAQWVSFYFNHANFSGTWGCTAKVAIDSACITLKDGTVLELSATNNDFACNDYGSYGALAVSGTVSPETDYGIHTWTFSQLIDLEQVEKVTMNGLAYYPE